MSLHIFLPLRPYRPFHSPLLLLLPVSLLSILLLSIHFIHAPVRLPLITTIAPIFTSTPFPPLPAPPTRTEAPVLLLLPKDNTTHGDYGAFPPYSPWLEHAIKNRVAYAKFHGYNFMHANLALPQYSREFKESPQWAKITALYHALSTSPLDDGWIWVLDSDAIIMSPQIDLHSLLLSPEVMRRKVLGEQLIQVHGLNHLRFQRNASAVTAPTPVDPESIYLLITQDGNGLNAGSFFVRRNAYMLSFVDLWRDPYFVRAGFTFREQDGLAHLCVAHHEFAKRVGVVEQRVINAYPGGAAVWRAPGEEEEEEESEGNGGRGDLVVHFAGCKDSRLGMEKCNEIFREFWEKREVLPDTEEGGAVMRTEPRSYDGYLSGRRGG